MSKILEGNFYNPSQGNLSINQVIEEILSYMDFDIDKFYDVILKQLKKAVSNEYNSKNIKIEA